MATYITLPIVAVNGASGHAAIHNAARTALSDLDAALAAHDVDTTSVHGIADTAQLATKAYADAAVTAEATARDAAITANLTLPGLILPVLHGLATGAGNTTTANRAHYMRMAEAGTITKVAIIVQIQSGNISVGVYRNSGSGASAVPAARVATSGAVACPATGYQEVSLSGSIAVNKGDWLALSVDNTTAAFIGIAPAQILKPFHYSQDTAHPLPSSATPSPVGKTFHIMGVA